MSASNAAVCSSHLAPESAALEAPPRETIAMFIERGKTEKYGWLSAFDELDDYLGRIS